MEFSVEKNKLFSSPWPALTFNLPCQQGQPAGMRESLQRQSRSSAHSEISPLKYSR